MHGSIKKSGICVTIIVVFLMASACGTQEQLATFTPTKTVTLPSPTPTIQTILPSPVPATWQTYSNGKFGLSMGHSKEWYPHEVQEQAGALIKFSTPVDNTSTQSWAIGEKASLWIWYEGMSAGETFGDWVSRKKNALDRSFKDVQQREIIVSGIKGVEFSTPLPNPFLEVIVPQGGYVYYFRLNVAPSIQQEYATYIKEFEQMLSTVRVDPTQIAPIPTATLTPAIGRTRTPPRTIPRPTTTAPIATRQILFTVTPIAASPTTRITVVPPSATTPLLASGVYVTNIRLEPPNPKNVDNVRFFVGFQNTAGPLKFKWCVYIFKVGQTNPIGQTSCDAWVDFPLGSYEYVAPNTWRFGTGQPCTDFLAQVQGVEIDGKRLIFKNPHGDENGIYFQVCP
jgi:hypothetical protein